MPITSDDLKELIDQAQLLTDLLKVKAQELQLEERTSSPSSAPAPRLDRIP